MTDYKQKVQERVDAILPELIALSDDIWHHPEYNFQEFHACQAMSEALRHYGFHVTTGVGGITTSVQADYDSGKPGPHIGVFGEFDAVPGMGHSCGHNLMCAMSVGAGEAIRSVIDELGGKVTVFGCPAEEGGGGKIIMLDKGVFRGLDIGMLLHSATDTVVNDKSFSKTMLKVHFYGKRSTAATFPEEGINALLPVIELFNIVHAMRLELPERGNITGVILEGGESSSYIPDHCSAEFTVRSFSMKTKKKLLKRFLDTCEHLAAITNTRFEYEQLSHPYEDIRNNPVIEDLLSANFTALGEEVKPRSTIVDIGSTDMGNITHELPALQSYVGVVPHLRNHSPEFQAAVGSPAGHKTIAVGSKAMAMTAVDVLTHPEYLDQIRAAFREMKAKFE